MTDAYRKAYTEVLEMLAHLPKEEYNKIPKEKIDFFEANMDKDYDFHIDTSENLLNQNISKEANAIIVSLFRDYFANKQQKEILKNILDYNEIVLEEQKRKKYSTDNIFGNKNS